MEQRTAPPLATVLARMSFSSDTKRIPLMRNDISRSRPCVKVTRNAQRLNTLMNGLNEIAATLALAERSDAFCARQRRASSWRDDSEPKGGAA